MTASEDGEPFASKPLVGLKGAYPIFAFQILPPEAPARATRMSLGLGMVLA